MTSVTRNPDPAPAPLTVTRMWRNAVERWPDRPFLVDGEDVYTYAQVAAQAEQVASGLDALGVRPGDRIAIWMSNMPEWVVAQCATSLLGAVLVPANTRLREDDLAYLLDDCAATVLITQEHSDELDYAGLVEKITAGDALPALRNVVVVGATEDRPAPFLRWEQLFATSRTWDRPAEPALDDLAYILYTSGTTASPKGVMLSHRNLNNSQNIAEQMTDGEVVLTEFPLFAITGCHNVILAGLHVGATVVIQRRFDPEDAIALIERHRATSFAGLTQLLQALVDAPGFSPERVRTLQRANVFPRRPEHLGLFRSVAVDRAGTGYGLTETAGPVTKNTILAEGDVMTHEGWPHPGNEIEIRGFDGRPATPGEEGEIVVRSPQVMLGYFGNEEATRAVLEPDGALRTGDVGRINPDGSLTWIGRAKDVFKCSGFNVASMEVEAFLRTHPDIVDAAVIGVPDRYKGEVGAAFIEVRPGAALEPAGVVAYCQGRIASYKIPGHVRLVEAFPKTASGKIRKVELRAAFHEDAGGETGDPSRVAGGASS